MTTASEREGPAPGVDTQLAARGALALRKAARRWSAALLLVCVGAIWLEFKHIEGSLPYPLHVDEGYVAGPAHRTLDTGSFHPGNFNYPSLPKYVASVGMAIGFLRSASHSGIRELRKIGNTDYPYYDVPIVMGTARQLFVVLSVIAVAVTGLSAWLAFQRPAGILLAPVILLSSPLFFTASWTYLNVDIVGACFVTFTIAACLIGTGRPSIHQSAVIPGVLAGCATGSKYTLAVVIVPVLLAIAFYFKGARRYWASLAALATMAAAFVVVMPYSVLDIPNFLNGLGFEAFHYASGHRGFQDDPGLPQLLYYGRHFVSEFGVGVLLALAGALAYAWTDWRRALVLVSFPLVLLWLLTSQRTHFERNVLSLHPIVAIFAAFGLIRLHAWVLAWTARRTGRTMPAHAGRRALVGALLVLVTVPLWHLPRALRVRTDSRTRAVAWLQEHLVGEWTIIVPKQLAFDARELERRGRRVVEVDLQSARTPEAIASALAVAPRPAVVLVPRWGGDPRYRNAEVADVLNDLARRWSPIESFGTNPVLVNYTHPVPRGNPAFFVAPAK